MATLQTINVNVFAKPEARRLQTFLVLSQNENGRQIAFRILGMDIPEGSTATFAGTKPDGNLYSTSGTISDNYVLVTEDIQMTAVAGTWDAKLDIVNGANNIMTAVIRVTIDADPSEGGADSDSQLEGLVAQAKYYAENAKSDAYGSPLVANTAAEMIDTSKVYVYTGSEDGYSTGYWYYYNGTAWTVGSAYNGVAVITDSTLTQEDMAADAKAVGDAITQLNADITANYVALPSANDYGTSGQYPRSTGSGIEWTDYGLPSDEQTAQAVTDWLDAHPEATTTVQDGSITYRKLGADLNLYQVVEDYASLLETTAKKVLVVHNDSSLGDGGCCLFETREGESLGGYARNDGSVVFAVLDQSDLQSTNPPIKAIADVATSYYDRDNLVYGNDYTLFNNETTNEIDCSSYVCAVLQGIKYEESKYVGGTNPVGVYIGANKIPSTSSAERTNALLTWELAEWFAERKQLYSLNKPDFDTRKLQFGDILFFSSHVNNTRFLGIDHCAMVVQVFPDQTALILQAGVAGNPTLSNNITTVVKMTLINMYDYVGNNIVAFARPSYGNGDNYSKRIDAPFPYASATKNIVTGNTWLSQIYLKTPLKPRTLYSLNLKGNLVDYGENKAYMFARLNQEDNDNVINFIRYYRGKGDKDAVWTICGVTPADLGTNPKDVWLYASGDADASGTAKIEYASLYEGVEYKDPSRNDVEITSSITGFVNNSYEYDGDIYIKCDVPLTGLTGDAEIATLPPTLIPYTSNLFIVGNIGYTQTVPIRITNGKMYCALASASTATLRIRQKLETF